MPNVLLQPRGTDRARGREHFDRSVAFGVPFSECAPHLAPADAAVLRSIPGRLRIWGSTPPTRRDAKARALRDRAVGDAVFFCAETKVIARGRIAHLMDNAVLADEIWGRDENGATWQHVVVLADVVHYDVPSKPLLDAVGVPDAVRHITLLSPDMSARFLAEWAPYDVPEPLGDAAEILHDALGVPLRTVARRRVNVVAVDGPFVRIETEHSAPRTVSVHNVQRGLDRLRDTGSVLVKDLGRDNAFIGAVLASLPGATFLHGPARVILSAPISDDESIAPDFGDLDVETRARVRKEQGRLRALLLAGADSGLCALCRDEFPAGFLVAAHVKRRSFCDNSERADLANVAMLACVFGCDALFEKGYVSVDRYGRIAASPAASSLSPIVAARAGALHGKDCFAYTPRAARYFEWHFDNVFRR